jgi:hypothetical protein
VLKRMLTPLQFQKKGFLQSGSIPSPMNFDSLL